MPGDFAVLTLTASSNAVGCSIGWSAGFVPNERNENRTAARRAAGHTLSDMEHWLRGARPHSAWHLIQDGLPSSKWPGSPRSFRARL